MQSVSWEDFYPSYGRLVLLVLGRPSGSCHTKYCWTWNETSKIIISIPKKLIGQRSQKTMISKQKQKGVCSKHFCRVIEKGLFLKIFFYSKFRINIGDLLATLDPFCQADIRGDILPIFVCLSIRYRLISADISFIDRNTPQIADIYLPIHILLGRRFFSLIRKQKPWSVRVLYHGNQNKYFNIRTQFFHIRSNLY